MVVFGVGLVARIEFVRGIANVVCSFMVLSGIFMMWGSLVMSMISTPFGILYLCLGVLRILTSGFMIYLLGETDQFAPNI